MPGKVNPSVPEMVNQVCFQVFGCDADDPRGRRRRAARAERDDAGDRLERAARDAHPARRRCACCRRAASPASRRTKTRCRELLDRSTALATALSPYIGYAATAEIAKTSVATGTPIRELVRERGSCPTTSSTRILSAEAMTSPGHAGRTQKERTPVITTRPTRAPRAVTAAVAATPLAAAAAARPAVSAGAARRCSRVRIATRGSGPIRSWTRCGSPKAASSLTSAPAAAGSRCAWRARVGPNGTRLRRGRPAADDRSDQAPRRARESLQERRGRSSAPRRIRGCRRRLDAVLIVDAYHEMEQPVVAAAQRRRRAQAERPHRHRRIHEGRRRPGPADGRARRPRAGHPRRRGRRACG